MGVRNPGGLSVESFKARGQKPRSSQSYTSGMNFWRFLWNLWQASIHTDESEQEDYDESSLSTKAPFYDENIVISDSEGVITRNSDGSFSRMPSGDLSYESNPFETASLQGAAGFATADDDEGLEVTITNAGTGGSDEDSAPGGSGGGCDFGFGLWSLAVLAAWKFSKKR